MLFLSGLQPYDLKEQIISPSKPGSGASVLADKNAPRTIDLDIVLFDEQPLNIEFWAYAFVVVPLAELIPDFVHPVPRGKVVQSRRATAKAGLDRAAPGIIYILS